MINVQSCFYFSGINSLLLLLILSNLTARNRRNLGLCVTTDILIISTFSTNQIAQSMFDFLIIPVPLFHQINFMKMKKRRTGFPSRFTPAKPISFHIFMIIIKNRGETNSFIIIFVIFISS